jgi:hypothetical protein
VFVFAAFYAFFKLLDAVIGNRVSAEVELAGLDLPEMGVLGYPDFAISSGVIGGVAPSPIEVKEAQLALIGAPFDQERINAAAEACYLKARPLDNTDFVMGWRKQMARPFVQRALVELRGLRS